MKRQPAEKRERPPMPPLAVRVQVAERQFRQKFPDGSNIYDALAPDWSLTRRLQWLLFTLFKIERREGGAYTWEAGPCALDHDPALILRPYNRRIKDVASRYTPHAHDPDALIYREKADHQQKTTGRRPGASRTITTKGSDIGIKTKFARLEHAPRRKAAIPSRPNPWPKRKFRKP